jgi:signal transduction histidine kinase
VLRLALLERSPGFAAAMAKGEHLELGRRQPRSAMAVYEEAYETAATRTEQAEALNAMGRAALAAGDEEGVDGSHRRLHDLADVLDADGAHPLTLSYLRQARRFAEDSTGARTVELVESWRRAILEGSLPLHPGTRLAARELDLALRRYRWQIERPDLRLDLNRVGRLADFVAAYDRLLETAVVRPEATYLCGMGPGGRTYVAVLRPGADGGLRGAVVDLEALAGQLLTGDAGEALRAGGFGLILFDADDTAEFERRYGDDLRGVFGASTAIYRLNFGIFAHDQPFVFDHARNRNALLVTGVAFLAAAIGLGLWVLLRETGREVTTARLRSEFVANVSHELRTPLTSIRMYTETLLFDRVRSDEQRRSYLQTLMRESQRLSRMVGNILDFSRMESGRKSFELAEVDVEPVVRTTLEEFEPVFEEQGVAVVVEVAEGLPVIRADAEALETVVANLVGNAIKYSVDHRRIDITLGTADRFLVLEVADRGVGIPHGEHQTVFEKFRRASNAPDVATGTGLGLALVDGIVASHGGTVEALPRAGGGSRFRVHLPLTRSG